MSHPLKFAPLSLDVSHSIIVVDYESFKIKAQIRVFIIIWITFLVQMDNNKFPYMFDSSETNRPIGWTFVRIRIDITLYCAGMIQS